MSRIDTPQGSYYTLPNANILPFDGKLPELGQDVLVASGAQLIGDLRIGSQSSIWFNVVVRADVHHVRIGERTNIQDNTTVHVTEGRAPCIIGSDVTVGHNAILHACTVEDLCLIGMGAIVLDHAVIGKGSLVGAGALVTQGKIFPPHSLIVGSPAKVMRPLTEAEIEALKLSAVHYIETARYYF
jgi:carbonic anhydrase/acetyltransferase-like protein (isoleucine patch superfamily)